MASQVFFTLKSCFSFVDDRFLSEFLHRTMFSYGNSLWVSLCKFILNLFWFIAKCLTRGMADHKPQEDDPKVSNDLVVSKSYMDFFSEVVVTEEKEEEEEVLNFSFSLLGQDFKDSKGNSAETEDSAFLKEDCGPDVLQYQFTAGNNVLGFMEEPQAMSFTIQEMFLGSNDGKNINSRKIDGGVSENEHLLDHHSHPNASSNCDSVSLESGFWISDSDVEEQSIEDGTYEKKMADFSVRNSHADEILEEKEAFTSRQNKILIPEEADDDICYELPLIPRNQFSTSDSNPEPESSSDGMLEPPLSMISDDQKLEVIERNETQNEAIHGELCKDTEEVVDDEYIVLETQLSDANAEIIFDGAFDGEKEENWMDEEGRKGSLDSDSESDDEYEFDILLEHQQLLKQMKMERKNSKLKGLPTISEDEECETPKILEDLKPLRMDHKFEFKDLMTEIQKFYKSYAEKMRKLDILNYQTLHAISFLQLKDSQLSMPSKKSLYSSIKPFTLPSFSLFKQQRVYADPSLKSISEMHRDLELVYVGQVCLSWEILLWQYGKVKELLEHDSLRDIPHSYNQVAGEFQQFQVLLQRFLEDERFQGPRTQHYVKSRCFFCSLVQVPCIQDDCTKNKKEAIHDEEMNAISITMLAEAIKDSMQIFWEFIHADKEDASGAARNGDSDLLITVKTCLEKKERKIKDIQRSRNCIVKKFQKQQPIQSAALLISQVELRLVARVLIMSRLTRDHLIWCQMKLDNINIVNRKVVGVEPSFLLFPC